MITPSNFDLYSLYYDLLYEDKDYAKEAAYVIQAIGTLIPGRDNILELGSGTGGHAAALCAAGFKVTGLERSPEMVGLSRSKSIQGFSPHVADISNFELPEKFGAAISLFHVVSYLVDNERLISCFKSTWQHLNPGGIFLFDFWYSPAVYHFKPETRIKRLSNDSIEITRLAEPVIRDNENVVDVNYEIIAMDKRTGLAKIIKETHPMRHFSLPEIELLATITGFQLIRAEEFLSGRSAGKDTWGVCCILQKIMA